jgi:heme-degrading monooxygenase HmoA
MAETSDHVQDQGFGLACFKTHHPPQATPMIAIIFEVEPAEGRLDDYLEHAAALREELQRMPGFVSVERFRSLTNPAKLLSLSLWEDEGAITRWRCHAGHRASQAAGRNGIFAGYRLRVAAVLRDYGMAERREDAPADSNALWGL